MTDGKTRIRGAALAFESLRPDLAAVTFSLRTLGASLLALLAAFVLQLDSPYWAALTAWIVANPHPAHVWGRGFFRIVGTLTGAVAAIFLFAALNQSPTGFIVCLAVWLGVCAAVAVQLENFHAYAAVLSGYTAAIVGFQTLDHPANVFTVAVARVTCVLLGVVAVAVTSSVFHHDILLPEPKPMVRLPRNRPGWRESLVGGLRPALAVGLAGLLWVAFAMPSGPTVILIVAIFCGLFATHPAPHHAAVVFGVAVLASGFAAFVCRHYVFPELDSVPLLFLSLSVVLFPCGIAMAHPRTAFAAAGFIINFFNQLQLTNSMRYDVASFLNVFTASLLGCAITILAFLLVFPRPAAAAPAHA